MRIEECSQKFRIFYIGRERMDRIRDRRKRDLGIEKRRKQISYEFMRSIKSRSRRDWNLIFARIIESM